jgi:hypothetical protein
MVQVSAAIDGITNIGVGWTNQASTPYSSDLESYGAPNSGLFNPAAQNGFLAWTLSPVDATGTYTIGTTLTNYLTKIYVPANGTTTKAAIAPHANVANISAFYMALYSADLQTKIAVTAESHVAIGTSGNDVVYEPSWVTAANVIGGNFYYIGLIVGWATGAPTFAGSTAALSTAVLNAGLTASTGYSASNGTAATFPASYTAASNTLLTQAPWAAIL